MMPTRSECSEIYLGSGRTALSNVTLSIVPIQESSLKLLLEPREGHYSASIGGRMRGAALPARIFMLRIS